MGNNLIKRGKNPCSLFDKYYFGGEYLVRTSIRMMMLIFSYSWFGILGGIVGFFIPNPLDLAVKDHCVCGYAKIEHGTN